MQNLAFLDEETATIYEPNGKQISYSKINTFALFNIYVHISSSYDGENINNLKEYLLKRIGKEQRIEKIKEKYGKKIKQIELKNNDINLYDKNKNLIPLEQIYLSTLFIIFCDLKNSTEHEGVNALKEHIKERLKNIIKDS